MAANDPAVCGMVEARKLWGGEPLVVVSLGCGEKASPKPTQWNYGLSGAGIPAVEAVMDAGALVVDYQASRVLPGDYYRLNPVLGRHVRMDDASPGNLSFLTTLAANWIEENDVLLGDVADALGRSTG